MNKKTVNLDSAFEQLNRNIPDSELEKLGLEKLKELKHKTEEMINNNCNPMFGNLKSELIQLKRIIKKLSGE